MKEIKQDVYKETDAWSTVLFADPAALILMRVFAKIRIHPNVVTFFAFIPIALSCYSFMKGDRTSLIIGALLWQVSWIFDCTDGKLARYTNKVTKHGTKFDLYFDPVRKLSGIIALFFGVFMKRNELFMGLGLITFHYAIHILFHRVLRTDILRGEKYVTPVKDRLIKRVGEFYTSYDEQFLMLFIAPLVNSAKFIWFLASFLYLIKSLTAYLKWRKK